MKLRVSWWRRLPPALRVLLGVLGGLGFLFVLGLGRLAWAGDSGGSFGGSSFGGGGSGGSGDGAWIEIVFYIIYYGFRLLLLSPTAFCIVLGIVILIVVLSRKKGGADAKLTAAGTHIATGGQPWVVMVQLALPAAGLRRELCEPRLRGFGKTDIEAVRESRVRIDEVGVIYADKGSCWCARIFGGGDIGCETYEPDQPNDHELA